MSRDPGSEVVSADNRAHFHRMGPVQPRGIQFPRTTFGAKNLINFQPAWYTKYAWLEYSESKDAMFCFYCRLYGAQGGNVQSDFTETGCRNWKNALGETVSWRVVPDAVHIYLPLSVLPSCRGLRQVSTSN